MLVGIECDKCYDEGREDPFTEQIEKLLDGSYVWYCDNGHIDHMPSRKLLRCAYKGRHVHLPESTVKKWGKTPVSNTFYHEHSGYGIHPVARNHTRTDEKNRRYRTLEEFQEARKGGKL